MDANLGYLAGRLAAKAHINSWLKAMKHAYSSDAELQRDINQLYDSLNLPQSNAVIVRTTDKKGRAV